MRERILVADDEPQIVTMIKKYLDKEGYELLPANGGEEALSLISNKPDLIILDIMMPDKDGLSVCQAIRKVIDCPILFLTALAEDSDKILGFRAGADDYIVKPFSLTELGARVEAHLRREKRKANPSSRKSFGLFWIDYTAHEIGYETEVISFARKEYEIMEFLSMYPGQIFSRERIYENIWGYDSDGDSSAVTEHIKRIRQKLQGHGQAELIETVWGVGYRWKRI